MAKQAAAGEQAALRAKMDFLTAASHELRIPLTVVRGTAEIGLVLESGCEHADSTRDALRRILAGAVRMSQLLDDLLFLARSDTGDVRFDLQRLDAAELLRSVADRAADLARERGARLRPRLNVTGMLCADAALMERAILILIDNAAKYGSPRGIVELRARADADVLVIDVADQGSGIRESDLALIFERFYRAEPGMATRRATGAGLGLSIASVIVKSHRGEIGGTSRHGAGTVMTIRLPLAVEQQAQHPSLSRAPGEEVEGPAADLG